MRQVRVVIPMNLVFDCRGRDETQQLYLTHLKAAGVPVELGLDQRLHLPKGSLTVKPDSRSYHIVVIWEL